MIGSSKLNVDAANRFIAAGLNMPSITSSSTKDGVSPAKKKFTSREHKGAAKAKKKAKVSQ